MTTAPTTQPTATASEIPTIDSVIERLHNVHSEMWNMDRSVANQITKAIYELTEIRERNKQENET